MRYHLCVGGVSVCVYSWANSLAYRAPPDSANGHSTQVECHAKRMHWLCVSRIQQKFNHEFSVFKCMKGAQIYLKVSLPLSHTLSNTPKCPFLCWKALFH